MTTTEQITEAYTRSRESMIKYFSKGFFHGDFSTAEDCVQIAFLKALEKSSSFESRNGSSIDTWINRIARNTAITILRNSKNNHVDPTELDNCVIACKEPYFSHQLFLEELDVNLALAGCSRNECLTIYACCLGESLTNIKAGVAGNAVTQYAMKKRARKKLHTFYED